MSGASVGPSRSSPECYGGAVADREAGKCSVNVSYRSDSAGVRAPARRQPELLRFYRDHSSLPRTRMLKLTGLSFALSLSRAQGLSFSSSSSTGPPLFLALSRGGLGPPLRSLLLPSIAPVSRLNSSVLSVFLLHRDFPSPHPCHLLLSKEENGD